MFAGLLSLNVLLACAVSAKKKAIPKDKIIEIMKRIKLSDAFIGNLRQNVYKDFEVLRRFSC